MRLLRTFVPIVLGAWLAVVPAARAAEGPLPSPTPVPVVFPSPTAMPLPAEPSPDVIRRDPALGVALAVLPGYGLGHFLVGDHAGGIKFLALDLATTVVWALGPSVVSVVEGESPDKPTRNGFWVFLGGFLVWSAIKVWEAVDVGNYAAARDRRAALAPLTRLSFGLEEGGVRFGYQAVSF